MYYIYEFKNDELILYTSEEILEICNKYNNTILPQILGLEGNWKKPEKNCRGNITILKEMGITPYDWNIIILSITHNFFPDESFREKAKYIGFYDC